MKSRSIVLLLAAGVVSAACSRGNAPALREISTPVQAGVREAADPALSTDPATGDILLAWVAGDSSGYDLYFARSSDQGAHWSAPARVTQDAHELKPHAESSPRLVAGHNALALIWPSHIEVPGRRFPASQLRFSRSTDGGRSWSAPITLNDDTASALAGHTFHGATSVGDSVLVVAWLDSRTGAQVHRVANGDSTKHHDGDATIYTAVSRDFGSTWAVANEKHWGGACPCCRVSLGAMKDGSVVATWRGHFAGNVRDPVIARIGAQETQPTRVHNDGWVLDGCPHSGPAIAIDANDRAHVAWYTGESKHPGVYYARQNDEGRFRDPIGIVTGDVLPVAHPVMTLTKDGALLALNLDEKGERNLTLVRVSAMDRVSRTTVPQTLGADHPQIAATATGAVVAWTEKAGNSTRVRLGLVQ